MLIVPTHTPSHLKESSLDVETGPNVIWGNDDSLFGENKSKTPLQRNVDTLISPNLNDSGVEMTN